MGRPLLARPLIRMLHRPRRPWHRVVAALAGLLALLPGCGLPPLHPRQTLHVVVVPNESTDWLGNDYRDRRLWQALFDAFRRLHPDVSIDLSILSQESLAPMLERSGQRGLAPDLLLLRAPLAVALVQRGLLEPLPADAPAIRRASSPVAPHLLAQVRTKRGLAGLPTLSEPTLACYDRRRITTAPTSVDGLLDLAASGRSVGLAVDPVGLWWSAGALGARDVMFKSIAGVSTPPRPVAAAERQLVLRWLTWLRQATLQSHVELASGPQDLITGLEAGSLAWVPCFSLSLHRLERKLGRHLGVAALPSGPGGAASPFVASRVWAFGPNSSSRQRALAVELATLSLNPLVQRDVMIASGVVLPANRFVPVPVTSSSRLAVLARAMDQYNSKALSTNENLSADRLQRVLPPIETTITDVMVGVLPPQRAVDILVNLRFLR